MAQLLIIDDEEGICQLLALMGERMGHATETANTLAQGREKLGEKDFDVVFLDVKMPDGSGLDHLPEILSLGSQPEVIIMTGEGDPDGAELAMRNGAWDYVQKSSSLDAMRLPLVRALQYRNEKRTGKKSLVNIDRNGIIGTSDAISACLDRVARAAATDASVLISGETGTGKELVARAIHINSERRDNEFVIVDCASLTESLVESILFGHKKGAFTGAGEDRVGLVTQANGGTLFLDEIGEMPLSLQKVFLRVLQERRYRPVGAKKEVESDFRVVAATNRNLEEMAAAGQFRSDLLYRVRAVDIFVPPLRERKGDIKDLTLYHVATLCERNDQPIKAITPEFIEGLKSYDWPGNVRELVNELEWVLATVVGETILFFKHLPEKVRVQAARTRFNHQERKDPAEAVEADQFPTLKELRKKTIVNLERNYIKNLMRFVEGDVKKACRVSGLSRSRLYDLLKQYPVD